MFSKFLRIRMFWTHLKLSLGTRLIASADDELANDLAIWDDVQNTIERKAKSPTALKRIGASLHTLSHRMFERAEDLEIEQMQDDPTVRRDCDPRRAWRIRNGTGRGHH